MKRKIKLKILITYLFILITLFISVLSVIVLLTKETEANEWFGARKYSFTEDEIKRIASMCYHENGSSVAAMRAEASIMANLYEKNRSAPYNTAGLIKYITTSGWFSTTSHYYNPTTVSSEYLNAVKDVLINGNRYFPVYVDEHDCLSDITSVSNNGVYFNKNNRDQYIKGVTIIKNCYGSTYTFYCFPDSISDPFGYININTNAGDLTSIEIDTLPEKTNYYVGEEVNITGIKLTAEYDNGTWKEFSEGFEYTPKVLNNAGKQKITIVYEGKETEFEVDVKKEEPIVNVKCDKNIVIYENGRLPDITLTQGDTEGIVTWDNYTLEIGTKPYKWTFVPKNTNKYNNKTGEIQITVIEKELKGIAITNVPNRLGYIEGQSFDKAGMVVTATYNDGTTKEITNYTITDGDNLPVGQTSVTISYTEKGVTKTVIQEIRVIEKVVTGINVTKAPTNTNYIEGQNFNPAGMKVTATYNDGTTKEVTNYTVTDGNNLTVGKTSVTISYTEKGVTKETTQGITVLEKLRIEIDKYTENKEENNNYIENILPNTTIESMISKIHTNGTIEIYKETEKITDKNIKIATGMKIKITLNDEHMEYTVVVKGDLTGDGKMGDADLLKMARYKVGIDKNLIGGYLKAADINNNNEKADDIDLLKLARVLVGLDIL